MLLVKKIAEQKVALVVECSGGGGERHRSARQPAPRLSGHASQKRNSHCLVPHLHAPRRSSPTSTTSLTTTTMHASEYDYLFKLLLIGDSGVGKVMRAFCDFVAPGAGAIR